MKALLILHKKCWAYYWHVMESVRDPRRLRKLMKDVFGEDYEEGRELSLYEYTEHFLYRDQTEDDIFSADKKALKVLNDLWGIRPKKHPLLIYGYAYSKVKDE